MTQREQSQVDNTVCLAQQRVSKDKMTSSKWNLIDLLNSFQLVKHCSAHAGLHRQMGLSRWKSLLSYWKWTFTAHFTIVFVVHRINVRDLTMWRGLIKMSTTAAPSVLRFWTSLAPITPEINSLSGSGSEIDHFNLVCRSTVTEDQDGHHWSTRILTADKRNVPLLLCCLLIGLWPFC